MDGLPLQECQEICTGPQPAPAGGAPPARHGLIKQSNTVQRF